MTKASAQSFYRLSARLRAILVLLAALALAGGAATAATAAASAPTTRNSATASSASWPTCSPRATPATRTGCSPGPGT